MVAEEGPMHSWFLVNAIDSCHIRIRQSWELHFKFEAIWKMNLEVPDLNICRHSNFVFTFGNDDRTPLNPPC